MSTLNDLDRRMGNVETYLGLEHEPPLDRLSGIEHRLDSLRSLTQINGLSIGELTRKLTVMEVRQLDQGRDITELKTDVTELKTDVGELKVGVREILTLLSRTDETPAT